MGTGFHTIEVRTGNKAVFLFLALIIDAKISQMMEFHLSCSLLNLKKNFCKVAICFIN